GISGFGPQQTLAVLKHYAVELHPKTAVWLFYEGNDLVDAERYDQMRDTWRGRRGKLRAAWHRSFTRNASRAVVRLLRRCVPQADPQESFGVLRTADGRETTVYFVDKPVGLTASDLERLEKVRAAIEEAYALCRERGIRFVLVFVPSTYRVYRGLPNFRPGMESLAQLKINDLPERLRALAHRISPQMEFLDLLPALRAATAEGVLTFIPDDSHWTAQGHQTVAMAIHKHLGPR
ncbi:MAG: alginate O-acetyltransferase AlgX-related protein, partial [Gammaproteobacteria bacterium]